jgi:hypothetical protein
MESEISHKSRWRWHWLSPDRPLAESLSLLASVVAAVTFVILILDREHQHQTEIDTSNIAAWRLLANYEGQQYNIGQVFAMETLAKNNVSL